MEQNYAWAMEVLSKFISISNIRIVVEVGSRDGLDGMYLARKFKATTYIFEADPINAETCRRNLGKSKDLDYHFFELALSDTNGTVDFYSVDDHLYGNRGVSSLYEVSFKHRPRNDPDRNRGAIARKVTVQQGRYDQLNLPNPDLLAIDVEGAEASVLNGFGNQLSSVKVIILESSFWNNWKRNGGQFPQVHKYLAAHGFVFVACNQLGGSTPDFPSNPPLKRFLKRYQSAFDVAYVHNDLYTNWLDNSTES